MSTFAEIVDSILDQLAGYTAAPDAVTHLTADLTVNALTLSVDDPAILSRGFVEVDDEVIWVKTVAGNGTVTIPPYGRGYKGTKAASHYSGAAVRVAPNFTRFAVKREINNQIRAVYPLLYGVKAAPAFKWPGGFTYQFDLPSDAERVVDVRFRFSAIGGWERISAWEAEHGAPSDFTGGRFVSIYTSPPPGSDMQVLYACRPSVLVNDDDDFATVTGLHDGVRDVIELGVMARMARFLDAARLSVQSVASDDLDNPRAVGSATNVANDLYRQYQYRLAAEQQALATRYPPRIHRTR